MQNRNFSRALHLTKILQSPEKKIFTFGETSFQFVILSALGSDSTFLRKGNLHCEKPKIISPETIIQTFSGFSEEAARFAREQFHDQLNKLKGLGYQFKNILQKEESYNETFLSVQERVLSEKKSIIYDRAVLKAPVDLWQLALIKASFEIIRKSFSENLQDFSDRGYFLSEEQKRVNEIEILFEEAQQNNDYIHELAQTLQHYNVFKDYEERFFKIANKQ